MNENGTSAIVERTEDDALLQLGLADIEVLANRADRMVDALSKIMRAALRITTEKDWVIIGGTPYLQESGATKVARLFGISWKIHEGYPKKTMDSDGYPTYSYRMSFTMSGQSIEADGARCARDDFFAGKRTDRNGNPIQQKRVDEIPLDDVQRAAYTNCCNNGIKRLVPGLRNITPEDLASAGLNVKNINGYTFRSGTQGGRDPAKAAESGIVCERCAAPITQKVASYSQTKYSGHKLCMKCQKEADAGRFDPAELEEMIEGDADDYRERG